jgi:hypothetical protein
LSFTFLHHCRFSCHLFLNCHCYLPLRFAAIFLKVFARALALPVQPGLVIGVHLPSVPLRLIDAVAF